MRTDVRVTTHGEIKAAAPGAANATGPCWLHLDVMGQKKGVGEGGGEQGRGNTGKRVEGGLGMKNVTVTVGRMAAAAASATGAATETVSEITWATRRRLRREWGEGLLMTRGGKIRRERWESACPERVGGRGCVPEE